MDPKCPGCPIGGSCQSYESLCENHASMPGRWRPVVDKVNGIEYPPLLTQVGNYVKSTVAHVASGCKVRDQDEIDRCLAICETCDQYDAKKKKCRACGCPTKAKARRAGESCPLGRWKEGE